MQYTLKKLNEMYAAAEKKLNAGKIDPLEAKLGVAAGYACDFLESAASSRVSLQFNILDEESIPKVAAVIHLQNIRGGLTADESREDLKMKMASFELFAILNSFNDTEPNVEAVMPGALSLCPIPLIRTLPKADQFERAFDVYAAMERTADSFILGSNTEDGRFFQGRMLAFHELFMKFMQSTVKNGYLGFDIRDSQNMHLRSFFVEHIHISAACQTAETVKKGKKIEFFRFFSSR